MKRIFLSPLANLAMCRNASLVAASTVPPESMTEEEIDAA